MNDDIEIEVSFRHQYLQSMIHSESSGGDLLFFELLPNVKIERSVKMTGGPDSRQRNYGGMTEIVSTTGKAIARISAIAKVMKDWAAKSFGRQTVFKFTNGQKVIEVRSADLARDEQVIARLVACVNETGERRFSISTYELKEEAPPPAVEEGRKKVIGPE